MRVIELDGRDWRTAIDFLTALRASIGAPEQHGWNPDAFVDSMIYGGINSVNRHTRFWSREAEIHRKKSAITLR